jgi:hypothetical protein
MNDEEANMAYDDDSDLEVVLFTYVNMNYNR